MPFFAMQSFLPTIAAMQLDLFSGTVGVLAAIAISFAAIVLVASYYRFQHIVQMAESTQPEEMGATPEAVLYVQLARYLAGCARRGTAFSLALVRNTTPGARVRMESSLILGLKAVGRRDDVTCIYDDKTGAFLFESDPEDAEKILTRIINRASAVHADISLGSLRVGLASYPGHGLRAKDLIRVALEGLEQTTVEKPVVLPEIVDVDADDEGEVEDKAEIEEVEIPQSPEDEGVDVFEEEDAVTGWKDRRKSAMLDSLTGVLKPSAISPYMQRMMNEIRRKKTHAALFCIGVNNIDQIIRFHGEDAADQVLVQVSKVLQDNLRGEDLIGRHEKNAFLVLAIASLDEAEVIGKRVSTLVQKEEIIFEGKKLRTTIVLGVAAYPDHGLNLHQLYEAGQRVLDHSRINDIRAYAVYDPKIHDTMPSKPMRSIKSIQAD